MSDTEDKKPESELGVDFGDVDIPEPDTPPKPGAQVYETANKYLKPTNVPGKPQEDVFNVTRAFDEDAVEMGTIVSDKKRKRSPLGKTIKSAFNEWWGKTQRSLDKGVKIIEKEFDEKDSDKEVVVLKNEDRSEIIKKAKEKTTQPPKADHRITLEKSNTYQKDVARAKGTPYTIKKDVPPTPEWKTKEEVPQKETLVEKPKTQVPVAPPDLRNTMVAPAVKERTQEKLHSYKALGAQKKEAKPEKKEIEVPQKHIGKPPPRKLPPIKPRESETSSSSPIFIAPKVTTHSSYSHKKEETLPVSQTKEKQQSKPVSQTPLNPPSYHAPKQKTEETPPLKEPQKETGSVKEEAVSQSPVLQEQVPQKIKSVGSHVQPTTHTVTPPEHDIAMPIHAVSLSKKEKKHSGGKKTTILIWVAVVVIMLVLGVVLAMWLLKQPDTSVVDPVPQQGETVVVMPAHVPSFLVVDTQTPIPFSNDGQVLLYSLTEATQTTLGGVTQFYPVRENETKVSLVTTWDIFTALDTQLSTRVIRSLDTVSMFGAVTTDRVEPFMLVRSYNFDYLFAGMLEWEPHVYDDLSPLFGTGPLSTNEFTDVVRNNVPVRILYDSDDVVMLYAFLNRDTVVITTSFSALNAIIERF